MSARFQFAICCIIAGLLGVLSGLTAVAGETTRAFVWGIAGLIWAWNAIVARKKL